MSAGTTLFGVEAPVQDRASLPPEQREAVLEQLNRIVSHPLFKHSKHYPAFLRFVVERSLEGQEVRLKERAIGIEVFGRGRDYDTNLDPVVRTSACEVRKRVAQYYHESGRANEVRIELHSGSYVPEFRFPEAATPAVPLHRGRLKLIAVLLATPLFLALGIGGTKWRNPVPPLEQFWAPVWGTSETIMVCMGEPRSPMPAEPSVLDVMHADRLAFSDAVTMGRITGLLRANRNRHDIRHGQDFTLTELRKGPAVLIGAFNNDWTMRLQDTLRFYFEKDPATGATYIRDRLSPSETRWKGEPTMPYSKFSEDFAIISRFVNPLTEKMVVVVAGMAKDGTMAAGEFVSEPQYLQSLAREAPAGWQHKNIQVVLRTEVVKGSPGPPEIVAIHTW